MNTTKKIMQITGSKVFCSSRLVVGTIYQNVLYCQQTVTRRTVRTILLFQEVRMREESMTNTSSMKNNLISSDGHIFEFRFTNNGFNHLKFIKLNLIPMILPNSSKVNVDSMFEICVRNLYIH